MKVRKIFHLTLIIITLVIPFLSTQISQAAAPEYTTGEPNIIYVPGDYPNLQDAIDIANDGDIIEIAAGTYNTPADGFILNNLAVSFTIQAVPGATVILDGRGSKKLLEARNPSASEAGHFVFKNLIFANGFTDEDRTGAISLKDANATFIGCTFRDNVKATSPSTSAGGAITVRSNSTAFFFNSVWENNLSEDGGAGLTVRESTVYVHNSEFLYNRNIAVVASYVPRGAAINVAAYSNLYVSNTLFDGNRSGGHGAAIWAAGYFNEVATNVVIVNSTFTDNHIDRDISAPAPIVGGAISSEDHVDLRIYNSRFIQNSATIGGAIALFRSQAKIYSSVFLGNWAEDRSGAINFNFHDNPNYPSLLIEDTYIQGRYGSTTTVGNQAGGLHAGGNPAAAKPPVTLRRVIFNDLDVTGTVGEEARGGAMTINDVDFLMEDSFILHSDALSDGGMGGGILLHYNTNATIKRSVFAYNTAGERGGGLHISGANVTVGYCTFLGNEVSPGYSEDETSSQGAALYSTPNSEMDDDVTGVIRNSMFVDNIGLAIYDDEWVGGPINDIVYNNNQFYETTFGDKVYKTKTENGAKTVAELNALIITRGSGKPSTDKSLIDNIELQNEPVIAKILGAPPLILPLAAKGDPVQTTKSSLAYVWNGLAANLNGIPLSDQVGIYETQDSGGNTLTVDGTNASFQVINGSAPFFNLTFTAGDPNILEWEHASGTFLNVFISHGIDITSTPSGSVELPSDIDTYYFYGITEEGGFFSEVGMNSSTKHIFLPLIIR